MPISPLCDRNTVNKPDSQIGFLKFVIRPTYLLLGKILPRVEEEVMPIIDEQIEYWANEKAIKCIVGKERHERPTSIIEEGFIDESERSSAGKGNESGSASVGG